VERPASAPPSSSGLAERAAASSTPGYDMEHALARLGGDRKLLREMMTIFRAESTGLMKTIRESAASGDLAALRRAAHTLKGALGTLGAPRALDGARHLVCGAP